MKRSSLMCAVGLLICLSDPVGVTQPNQPLPDPETGAAIGFIATREHRIELKAGGTLTLRAKGGETFLKGVTLEQLRVADPRLYQILKRAVAASGRHNDASLRPAD